MTSYDAKHSIVRLRGRALRPVADRIAAVGAAAAHNWHFRVTQLMRQIRLLIFLHVITPRLVWMRCVGFIPLRLFRRVLAAAHPRDDFGKAGGDFSVIFTPVRN